MNTSRIVVGLVLLLASGSASLGCLSEVYDSDDCYAEHGDWRGGAGCGIGHCVYPDEQHASLPADDGSYVPSRPDASLPDDGDAGIELRDSGTPGDADADAAADADAQ